MITYLKHMGKYNHNQLKSKSFEEIQKLYKKEQQWITDFVPMSDISGKKDDSSSKQAKSNLKTLLKPCEEDEVWRNQQGYNLISWRLFDSCGVHVLLMDNGIAIHMMIRKEISFLLKKCLSTDVNRRLEVNHEAK
ncbi:hypothetical protein Tco_1335307 [Tanacetum coccineum]